MIGWWMLGEILLRRSAWTIPNLLASTYYGDRAYRHGFTIPTWSGLATAFAVYCAAGVLFALAGRERKGGWILILVGVATGLAFDWLFFRVIFNRLNPLAELYMPDRLVTISHLLYGTALASYPGFFRRFDPQREPSITIVPPPLPGSLEQVSGAVPEAAAEAEGRDVLF